MNLVNSIRRSRSVARFSAGLPEIDALSSLRYVEVVRSAAIQGDDCIAKSVEKALWQKLPFAKLFSAAGTSKHSLIKCYVASAEHLNDRYFEWCDFCERLVRSMIECRGKAPSWAKAIDESQNAIIAAIDYRQFPGARLITADFATRSEEDIFSTLRTDLVQRAANLAAHCQHVLRSGAESNWLGLVTWLDSRTCRYTYTSAPIISLGKQETRQERSGDVIRIHESFAFQHRQGVHEHHLIKARYSPGVPSKLSVPTRLHLLVDSIPTMLKPLVGLVDGVLIGERIIEWDLFRSAVESERTIPVPMRQPDWDPALCIGPFVIAGWSNRDFPSQPQSLRDVMGAAWRSADRCRALFGNG